MTERLYINKDHAQIDNALICYKRGLITLYECTKLILELSNNDPGSKYNLKRGINRITYITNKYYK